MWRFINSTSGRRFECQDLDYLVYMLIDDDTLRLPLSLAPSLLIRGYFECVVEDEDGVSNSIRIEEVTL